VTDPAQTTEPVGPADKWRLVVVTIIVVVMFYGYPAIPFVVGEQIGLVAAISPGIWPDGAIRAILSGLLSGRTLSLVGFSCAVFPAFMSIVNEWGSRSPQKQLGEQFTLVRERLASVRVMAAKWDKGLFFLQIGWFVFGAGALVVIFGWFTLWFVLLLVSTVLLCRQTAGYRDLFFWIWLVLGASLLLALVFGRFALLVGVVASLYLLAVSIIGAIKSTVAQVLAVMFVALSMGFASGFWQPEAHDFHCDGDGEFVLSSGEHVHCATWKELRGREFILVQGTAANAFVWLNEVEPASRRHTLGF